MDTLTFNFLKIIPEEFNFTIYRKEYKNEKELVDIYRYRLPIYDNASSEKADYLVSFNKKAKYKTYLCASNTNIYLTNRYLFHLFLEHIQTLKISFKYCIYEKNIFKRVEFVIEEFEYGSKVILFSPYYLKSKKQFGFLVDFAFRKKREVRFNREIQKLSLSLDEKYGSNRNYYSDKYKIITSFLENLSGYLSFSDKANSFKIETNFIELPEQKLKIKKYLFKNNGFDNSQFQGIRKHGVYKELSNNVIYAFIFEEKFKTLANNLYLSLIGKLTPGTFPGMKTMFNVPLNKNKVNRIELINYKKEILLEVVDKLKKIKDENANNKLIGIFIEPSKDENLDPIKSPYYILKYYSTLENIPLQVVNYEKMTSFNTLKWSAASIGLQIFAKLGGIPWKLEPSNERCLILGIGSAHEINDKGKLIKFFAYTICLNSSGIYHKIEILSEDKNYENYLQKLKDKLREVILDKQFKKYNKCALHLSFKIKHKEIISIKNAIDSIKNIEFTVIKINIKNRFFGYSHHNTLVPYESSYLQLANNEYLVWFDGLQYGKENVFRRIGNPVHIKFIYPEGPSNIMHYKSYLQDIINLSGANWRGFNAKQVPISIYYAKLLAHYTKAFKHFPDFNKDMFVNTLPWFL